MFATALIYFFMIAGFYVVLRGIYLFEKKNDDRAVKFLFKTCPYRYKFTAGTALFLVLAGYFGSMALIPLIIVNYVIGWVQYYYVHHWMRTGRIVLPFEFPKH